MSLMSHGHECEAAVEISLISHSIPEIQCTSGLQPAILNSGGRPMLSNVSSDTGGFGVVENLWVPFGIASLSHSVQSYFYFRSRVRHFEIRWSADVGQCLSDTDGSGLIDNVG